MAKPLPPFLVRALTVPSRPWWQRACITMRLVCKRCGRDLDATWVSQSPPWTRACARIYSACYPAMAKWMLQVSTRLRKRTYPP